MFGIFHHPKPVGSNRPVAELSVPSRQQKLFDARVLLISETKAQALDLQGDVAAARTPPALSFAHRFVPAANDIAPTT